MKTAVNLTYFDFTEERLIGIAKNAKEDGVELFVLDDGWFGFRCGERFDPGLLYYAPQCWIYDDSDSVERQLNRITPLKTRGDMAAFGAFSVHSVTSWIWPNSRWKNGS